MKNRDFGPLGQEEPTKPSREIAAEHIRLLTGSADTPMYFRLLRGQDDPKESRAIVGTLAECWAELERLNLEGWELYIVVNEGTGYRSKDITGTRALFIDADGRPTPSEWHVDPSFITRRDAIHWHGYWVTDGSIPLAEFKTAQRRLIAHYGTDRGINDLQRVLRLAGSLHLKDPNNPILVAVEDYASWLGRRDLDTLMDGLPDAAEEREADLDQDLVASNEDDVIAALGVISNDDRHWEDWNTIGMAFFNATEGSGEGLAAWLAFSAKSTKYDAGGAQGRWDYWDSDHQADRIGAAKIFALAKEAVPGWIRPSFVYDPAARMREQTKGQEGDTTDPDDAFFAKFMDVAGSAGEREIDLSKSVDYDGYLFSSEPPPDLAVLFGGWVSRGHFIPISGPGGVHKSRFCAQLTLALRYGRGLLKLADRWACDSVVSWIEYLSYENSKEEDHRRLKAMARAAGLEQLPNVAPAKIHQLKEQGQPPLLIVPDTNDPADIILTKFGKQMLRRWSTMLGHKVIIPDSFFNAVQFQGKTKVSDAHADQVVRLFDHWCDLLDATIISPFHPSRAGVARGDLGHSGRFDDAPRQALMIEEETKTAQGRKKPTGTFSLRIKKWNDGPQGREIGFAFADGMLVGIEARDNSSPPIVAAEIILQATYGRENLTDPDAKIMDRENLERLAADGFRLHQDGRYRDGRESGLQRMLAPHHLMNLFRVRTNRARASVAEFVAACEEAVRMGLMGYNPARPGRHERLDYRVGYCLPPVDDAAKEESDDEAEGF